MERIFQWIKDFFSDPNFHKLVEIGALHLFFLGLGIVFVLIIILLFRTQKDLKRQRREDRKRGKSLMKFLSNKKNKTY